MNEEELVVQTEPAERPIRLFFQDTVQCLTEPRKFFTVRYPEFTLTRALVFALILNWIASFLEWLTRMVKHETLLGGFIQMKEQLETLPFWKGVIPHILADSTNANMMPAWIMEFGSIALNPFKTLIGLTVTTFFVWIGGLLLIPKTDDRDPITYVSFLKVLAVATSAPQIIGAILGFLPLGLGLLIGYIYVLVIEAFAISIRFKVSMMRALTVKYLPSMVITAVVGIFIVIFAALLFGLLSSAFH